jgi:hypothetical protein
MKKPEPVPTDPWQKLDIKCAFCAKPIDFRKQEVYSNWPSYVCKQCANKPHPGRITKGK